jgi:hypothetical protein
VATEIAKDYRQLAVWQKTMDLTIEIYRLTRAFPREEVYGLTSQVRPSRGYQSLRTSPKDTRAEQRKN